METDDCQGPANHSRAAAPAHLLINPWGVCVVMGGGSLCPLLSLRGRLRHRPHPQDTRLSPQTSAPLILVTPLPLSS
jgi:hypothetical protein